MAELDQAAELATEAVGEAVSVARNHITWMWGGWCVGTAMGAATGYLIARGRLETKYEKLAENEIDQMREHFRQRLVVRDTKPDLEGLTSRLEDLGYYRKSEKESAGSPPAPSPPGVPNVQPAETSRNVFDSVKPTYDEWDWEAEKVLREAGARVFVIHQDEFGDTDNPETTLSYYEGDDVLCDENDRPIEDQHKLVGDCLDRFGQGSGDRNVVYIRNLDLEIDLEVTKSSKTYAEEVHGFKHEDPPRRRGSRRQE